MSEASGIPAWCRVGARVVCIKRGSWNRTYHGERKPTFGQVLTIRGVFKGVGSLGGVDLLFEEIVNQPHHYLEGFFESRFHYSRFRPAVPPKTQAEDVGLFRHHLDDVRAVA